MQFQKNKKQNKTTKKTTKKNKKKTNVSICSSSVNHFFTDVYINLMYPLSKIRCALHVTVLNVVQYCTCEKRSQIILNKIKRNGIYVQSSMTLIYDKIVMRIVDAVKCFIKKTC